MQPPNLSVYRYPQSGEVLDGKYRVERMLGEGGMGAVAKATHLLRRAPVALKFMSGAILSLPGAVERFVNEGVAASQIDSDHVVKVFDVGRLPSGAPYLVMEYLEGRDLGELLAADGPSIETARAVHFAIQMLRALHTAHNAGIVHRDMKPSNCFVIQKDGEADFVKLVDFGISKVRTSDDASQNANLTRTNSALGTPLYMSPEQARSPRDVDHRSDLYSVGAILYEMLCGRTPYTAESGEYTEILFKIFTTEPPPLLETRPGVPEGLAAVVHRALQRDRDARYASALEMAKALAPFADERSGALLAKIHAGRGRSPLSTAPAAATAAAPESIVRPAPVGQTHRVAADLPRRAGVPTHVGVTRDTQLPRRTNRRYALAGTITTLGLGLLAGGGFFATHPGHAARTAASVLQGPPEASSTPVDAARTFPSTAATAPSVAVLVPLPGGGEPAASPSTKTAQTAPIAPPQTTRPAPTSLPSQAAPAASLSPGPSTLPKQLSDLKLH
ncbi:MAG: protein kinase [Polyangiaceae bacterium]|jgi:serine/threonine-protein kinase